MDMCDDKRVKTEKHSCNDERLCMVLLGLAGGAGHEFEIDVQDLLVNSTTASHTIWRFVRPMSSNYWQGIFQQVSRKQDSQCSLSS